MSFYLSCCWASRKPITSVEFKFVARVVIRATKPKFVAKSRSRVYFAQMLPQLARLYFVARQVGHKRGNTRNNVL